ncbi:SDR family oxidoreductase [Hymenobacter sp. BT186]|uniref:SDR family oxidoreductase n=1 Tax=Hymenobacter telluris TaxID=2816474 RepID=A0A939ETD7_9BACT|nr:SDR family oxidoreductase [Hymenobacter telluris]MBO0356601.1 SDR family oxidoreductase [Hymenobacter telluris]MBW3372626.1 SDR family oxidoreductase [Hymenobacter norwichensis]
MILITGATGHLGTAVLQTLLQKTSASQLAALVRDEHKAADLQAQGVSLRLGSYNDLASLDRAMQGINKVLLISGGGEDDALQQHYNVVDAAKRAGVQCLAYTSRALKDPSALANQLMVRHFQTEDYIQASGLAYIFFRNILYLDTLPLFTGPNVLETGIRLPAGQGKVAYALRSEMGEAMANVLLQADCVNRTYHFTGSEAYSFDDVAAALTSLTGKEVRYTAAEPAAFAANMQQRGVPAVAIERTIGFMTDISHGQEAEVSSDLATALGRQPVSLAEGIKTVYKL